MSNQIHIIQNAITTTISEIFRGDFRRICEVKKAVLHLEAIYFCHGTCYLLKRENMPIKDQLALYQRIELIPQSTTEFFENNRECIINNWPEESALAAKPEILYDALLASEFCVQPERVGYKIDKVSRDIAGAYYTSSDFSAQITYRALESYMDRKRRRAIDSDSFACCNEYENITFLDYSCGCGEFLLAVIQYFDNYVLGYSRKKLATQLRGVDVNPIALMITIARIVSAVEAEDDENLLREVAKNFIVGNPLLHSDKIAPLEVRFDNFALNRLYAETEGINCLELEQQTLLSYETLEVLYRSESGDPILLFVSNDLGTVPTDTTELLLTDSHPDTLSWYPIPGIVALPYDSENERRLAYDFTFYSQEGNDGFGSDIGWTCPSGSQLTQEIWAWQGHTDKPALATLELHANSSQEDYWGAATFTWWYESDFVTPEEVYEGEWGLTANGEYSGVLMLDMTRTGGKRYTPGETERIIHDGFIVQVPMAFEDYTYLSVDKGQHGSYLPIQMEPDTVIYFYPW